MRAVRPNGLYRILKDGEAGAAFLLPDNRRLQHSAILVGRDMGVDL
jgi:hypothetical protein